MTDAHCHVSAGGDVREWLIGRDFVGVHPWETLDESARAAVLLAVDELRSRLAADPHLGVGEIGLDRLRVREVSALMREVFQRQLACAFELQRPVVLHGAKCWGQVVSAVREMRARYSSVPIPPLLFHGFSRADGLIPDICALGGFISVGPSILNTHAVNYRALVKKIPLAHLLVETDRTAANAAECPAVSDILASLAQVRGLADEELEAITDANAERFATR